MATYHKAETPHITVIHQNSKGCAEREILPSKKVSPTCTPTTVQYANNSPHTQYQEAMVEIVSNPRTAVVAMVWRR